MWVDVIRHVVGGDSDGCQKQKTFAAHYSFVAAFQTRLFFSKTVRQRRYIWVCFSDVRYNIVANSSGASKRRLTALGSDVALALSVFKGKANFGAVWKMFLKWRRPESHSGKRWYWSVSGVKRWRNKSAGPGDELSSPQSLCIIACISFFSTTVNKHRVVMLKTDNCATATFCPVCHYETDNGSHLEKVERRRLMSKVIVFTGIEPARCGLITPAMIKEW